jgi:hypothetical protein
MAEPLVVSGLKTKRAEVAGRIVDLRRELDQLQGDLIHIDAVLKLYGLLPNELPTKGRMPKSSAYFARQELSRRCCEMIREKGTIKADDVAVQAMRDKGLDPGGDHRTRVDFTKRILVTLHDLTKRGTVVKIGEGKGVLWRAAD